MRICSPFRNSDLLKTTLPIRKNSNKEVANHCWFLLIFDTEITIFSSSHLTGVKICEKSCILSRLFSAMITDKPIHSLFAQMLERATDLVQERIPKIITPMPNQTALDFLIQVTSAGLVIPVIVGPKEEMESKWKQSQKAVNFENFDENYLPEILDIRNSQEMVQTVSKVIRKQQADILLRGDVSITDLSQMVGIREGKVLCHIAVTALPKRNRFLTISDGGWNLLPDLHQTVGIIHNCVELLTAIGVSAPKIAVLSAVEEIDPSMPRTVEAASISQMSRRGVFYPARVDGPLRFDHAIALPLGHEPSFSSAVAGEADAVIASSLEEANILAKSLIYFGKGEFGSVILGGTIPIVYPSWQTPGNNPFLSLLIATLVWNSMVTKSKDGNNA
jgi:phosphate butyryltransferase